MAAVTTVTKALLGKALITGTASGTATTVCANIAGEDATVTVLTAYNQHTSAVDLYLLRVPDNAGAVGTGTDGDIFKYWSVPPKGTKILGPEDIKIPLNDTNDTIQAWVSVASKITVWADGIHEPTQ